MESKRFILASASPRRAEILTNSGYEFEVIVSDADESLPDGIAADKAVLLLSKIKAESVSKNNPEAVVLGCDTVVSLGGKILGKPKDEAQAFEMLRSLSGKIHKVYTGVTVTDGERTESCLCGETVITAEPATGHIDKDTDGVCDTCGEVICTCSCHQSGFKGLIYKLLRIFWKLFRVNKTCACGAVHY